MDMIFIEILHLNCYAVPELPSPGIPYITVCLFQTRDIKLNCALKQLICLLDTLSIHLIYEIILH